MRPSLYPTRVYRFIISWHVPFVRIKQRGVKEEAPSGGGENMGPGDILLFSKSAFSCACPPGKSQAAVSDHFKTETERLIQVEKAGL